MPLTSTLASHNAIGIGVGVISHHCIGVSKMWTVPLMAPLHCSGQDDQNDVQHDFLVHVTPQMAPLHSSGQDGIKMICNMTSLFMQHH